MLKRFLILLVFVVSAEFSFSQELNCQVDYATQIQGSTNKQIFDQLKKTVFEFMNNQKWTNHVYTATERIDCSLFFNITQVVGTDEYAATLQIESRRPVYKSSFNAPLFNYIDNNFQFKFQQFTNLQYNMNAFDNNLTAVLMYYAYVILAEDYDSYSPNGGTEFWQKAQLIVQNAQSASEKGWKSFESNKNRYWLVENQLQPLYQGIRDCMYKYHRNGMDIMSEKPDEGRAAILKSLELLIPVYKSRPASFNMEVFFIAKRDELVNIFSQGTSEEKNKAQETLMLVDPANTPKYLKITGG